MRIGARVVTVLISLGWIGHARMSGAAPFPTGNPDSRRIDIPFFQERVLDLEKIKTFDHWVRRPWVSDDRGFALGNAGKLETKFQMGVAPRLLRPRLPALAAGEMLTTDMDARCMLPRFHGMTASLSVDNVGQQLSFLRDEDKLPFHMGLDMAAEIGPLTAQISAKRFIHEQQTSVGTGVRYAIGSLSFRAGYGLLDGGGDRAYSVVRGFSGGFGLRKGATQIEYAISPSPSGPGPSQNLTLSLRWGAEDSSAPK